MRGSTLLQIEKKLPAASSFGSKTPITTTIIRLTLSPTRFNRFRCDPFSHHRFNFLISIASRKNVSIDFLKAPNCKQFCHVFPHVISHVFPIVCTPCGSVATAVIFYRFLNTLPASLRPPLLVPDGHGHRFAR